MAAATNYTTPLCRWACDEPTMRAVCRINVLPVACSYADPPQDAPSYCASVSVLGDIECPPTQDATSGAPQCTVRAPSTGTYPECGDLTCPPPVTSWVCEAPTANVQLPTCRLVCEHPADECAVDCAYPFPREEGGGDDGAQCPTADDTPPPPTCGDTLFAGLSVLGLVLLVASIGVSLAATARAAARKDQ